MKTDRPSILSIGDIVADIITVVHFPIQPGSVIMSHTPLVEPGGACNFAIAGARLGTQVAMIGAPGNDTFGRLIVDVLKAEGVETSLITPHLNVPTTLVIVLADPVQLTQTYISAPVLSTGMYDFSDAVRARLDASGALYVQGYTLCEDFLWEVTRESMRHACGRVPIYFDPSPLFASASSERQELALDLADVILSTEDELLLIAPDQPSAIERIFRGRAQMLIMKRGAQGCRIVTRTERIDIPGFPVKAIGAAAAGDTFNAGFISARLRGYSLTDAAIIANAVGAVKVTRLGGGRQVPQLHEVQTLLDAHGRGISLAGWRAAD